MKPSCLIALLACLLPGIAQAQHPGVKTVSFKSDSVGRTMKYNLVLPVNYDKGDQRYPVLYLLHGLTSNYTDWARMKVPEYAAKMDVIVVMPDVGNSWYVNWSKNENGQKNNWEDSIIKDLIPHVDATYRTIAKREGRAINGLSMGGYGGLMLGLKHHELFCSIGSHSGAIGYAKMYADRLKQNAPLKSTRAPSETPNAAIGIEGFSSQKERTPQGVCFGTPEECEKYDPFKLILEIPKEKLPHIYFDCGLEDRLIGSNLDFVKILTDNKIPFTFGQSPGGHKPDYWAREVGNSMAMQLAVMQRNLAAPKK
jgi:putative tributyrin esterase